MFLLFGDQYVGNPKIGRECHNKRVNFERLMRKYNKEKELKALLAISRHRPKNDITAYHNKTNKKG